MQEVEVLGVDQVLDTHIDQEYDQLHPVTRLATGIDQLTGSLIIQQPVSIDTVLTVAVASAHRSEVIIHITVLVYNEMSL